MIWTQKGMASAATSGFRLEEPLTLEQIQKQREEAEKQKADFPEAAYWSMLSGETLEIPNGWLSGVSSVSVLIMCGNPEWILPNQIVKGSYPAESDETGCAVSEGLAHALWGSGDVEGLPVTWKGNTYLVRGVFSGKEPVFAAQARDGAAKFYAAEVMPEMAMELSAQAGQLRLPALSRTLEGPLWTWGLSVISCLPALCAALAGTGRLFRAGASPEAREHAGWRLLPAVILCVLSWAVCGFPSLPSSMIPSKWSDFSFWADRWENAAASLRDFLSAPLDHKAAAVFGGGLAALFLVLLSLCFLYLSMERLPKGRAKPGQWFMFLLAVLLAELFLVIWKPAGTPLSFQFSYPLALAVGFFCQLHPQRGKTGEREPERRRSISLAPQRLAGWIQTKARSDQRKEKTP